MKRKSSCDLSDDLDVEFFPRPAKRLTMCHNTPKQARDEKKKLMRTCRKKLKQLTHPESDLHRSLMVNSVYRQLQAELKQDKPARSYGYAFNPKCPYGYGAGQKEVANRRKRSKLQDVLDRKSGEVGRVGGHHWTRSRLTETTPVTQHPAQCEVTRVNQNGADNTPQTAVQDDLHPSPCHVTEDHSDTEEIDVCTVDEDLDTLVRPSQYVCDTDRQVGVVHTKPRSVTDVSTMYMDYDQSNCAGTFLSEQASLGEFPCASTFPSGGFCDDYRMNPDFSAFTPDTDPHGQSCGSHTLNHTEPHMQAYSSHTDNHYLHSICLSQYYPSITPPGYLSPAYLHSLSTLYPGLTSLPVQATTPGVSLGHPTARTVACT